MWFSLLAFIWCVTDVSIEAFSLNSPPPASQPPPLYITIGPPCCGKTEALRSHLLTEGYNPDDVFSRDVALDDQSSVYHRIPLAAFLFPSTHLDPAVGNQLLQSGSTVQERLLDPSYDRTDQEIRHVIMRLAGRITTAEFAERIKELTERAGDTIKFFQKRRRAVAYDLVGAVEQVATQAVGEVICQMQLKRDAEQQQHDDDELPYEEEQKETLDLRTVINGTQAHLLSARQLIRTPHVEIFVPQALFHGGIDSAEQALTKMLQSSKTTPVFWSNTNTRPTEYAAALKAAEQTGRPVQFIAWGTCRMPRVPRKELLRRNVARFRSTGRYIPCGAIGAALGRVESLIKEAEKQADLLLEGEMCCPPNVAPDEWEARRMDIGLADLAGFRMDEKGFVVQVGEPKRLRSKAFQAKRKTMKTLKDSNVSLVKSPKW